MPQTALVVIDMQNGFITDCTTHVVPQVTMLVRLCAGRDLDLVFTKFRNRSGSAYERLLDWPDMQRSPDVDLVGELQPFATCTIEKGGYSAFTPEFEALSKERRWDRLLICGIDSDGCVLKTAFDTFERNLIPVVVKDACASNGGAALHDAAMVMLARSIGPRQVIDIADVETFLDAG